MEGLRGMAGNDVVFPFRLPGVARLLLLFPNHRILARWLYSPGHCSGTYVLSLVTKEPSDSRGKDRRHPLTGEPSMAEHGQCAHTVHTEL